MAAGSAGCSNRPARAGCPPGARATPEAIAGYVAALQAQNAPQSVLVRLQSLAVVLGWLDPDEAPKPWLRRILARLEATGSRCATSARGCAAPMPLRARPAADGRAPRPAAKPRSGRSVTATG